MRRRSFPVSRRLSTSRANISTAHRAPIWWSRPPSSSNRTTTPSAICSRTTASGSIDEPVDAAQVENFDDSTTDDKGPVSFDMTPDDLPDTPAAAEGHLAHGGLRVRRPAGDQDAGAADPQPSAQLGIKPLFSDDAVEGGADAGFDVIGGQCRGQGRGQADHTAWCRRTGTISGSTGRQLGLQGRHPRQAGGRHGQAGSTPTSPANSPSRSIGVTIGWRSSTRLGCCLQLSLLCRMGRRTGHRRHAGQAADRRRQEATTRRATRPRF